jgi:hypothetical protein
MNDPYYAKWAKIMKDLETGEFAPDSIDPRDVSVQFGKPMTEEEFKNRTVGGQPVHVIKAPDTRQGAPDPKQSLKAKIDAMAKARSGNK